LLGGENIITRPIASESGDVTAEGSTEWSVGGARKMRPRGQPRKKGGGSRDGKTEKKGCANDGKKRQIRSIAGKYRARRPISKES